jgi:hypothetical protein
MNRYSIQYNGMTSFVPPTFCWDIIDESGNEQTVSDLDFSALSTDPGEREQLRQRALTAGLVAHGTVTEYPRPDGKAGPLGRRLVVARVE